MNDEYTVKLTYFKKSGKFYDCAEMTVSKGYSLFDIWEKVKKLQFSGALPGLFNGAGEEFIILVETDHEHAHPVLIGI